MSVGSTPGHLSDVDLKLLRCFLVVADCGGISASETELNQETSSISRQIRDLETRLGFVLCRRGRSGFALTPEGHLIYKATQQLFAAASVFCENIHGIQRRLSGCLQIGVFEKSASNPNAHIDDALAIFRQRAPDVDLRLHVGSVTSIERGVMEGQFHLGIVPEHRRLECLDYQPLYSEQLHLYVGSGHPLFEAPDQDLTWERIASLPIASLGYHTLGQFHRLDKRLSASAIGSDQEAVALMVLSGQFIGFLPDHYAKQFVDRRRMRAIYPTRYKHQTINSCIYKKAEAPLRVMEAFRQALLEVHDIEYQSHVPQDFQATV
jgi:DNA-binding transcriptional LysR family regulator